MRRPKILATERSVEGQGRPPWGPRLAYALPHPPKRSDPIRRTSVQSAELAQASETRRTTGSSDGTLIERVAARDETAFEELYRRYARAVLGLAIRRLGDRQAAEEALQETFMAVWRSAWSYRPDRGAGGAWLYAVAGNSIVDRYRARSKAVGEPPERVSLERGPEEHAEASFVAWRIHRAIEDLPVSERRVLELAYWSGLSQSEVSNRLGVPLGTVKTRTRTALARLADVLEGEELR